MSGECDAEAVTLPRIIRNVDAYMKEIGRQAIARAGRVPVQPSPAPAKSVCTDLPMKEAAAYIGKHYGTFRNNWKGWGITRLRSGLFSIKELDRWKVEGKRENKPAQKRTQAIAQSGPRQ